ncbi:hypothetical protein GWN91_06460 [Candidatus Saccharibacteria bacterium]|nr:hypothetical protein [Candidatus Saccharibacteria bacterium]NIW80209.1 hypothetical protein [Calditrichia bacterium]
MTRNLKFSNFSWLLIFFSFISISLSAQEENHTKVGLSALLQDSQLDIVLPIWTSQKFALVPGVSFVSIEDGGTDIGIGLSLRNYFKETEIAPFITGRFAALISSPAEGDSTTDFVAGIGTGGEYFLHEQFSLGVEGQLNFSFSDDQSSRFGNPGGMNINTASVVFATVYF